MHIDGHYCDNYNINMLFYVTIFFFFSNLVIVSQALIRARTDLGSVETIISEADHNRAASFKLEALLDGAVSLQSTKYFPVTLLSLGFVAT